jgi:hypothetical protein
MAKRPDSVNVGFSQPLRIETGAPLAVRLETPAPPPAPPSRWKPIVQAGLVALLLAFAIFAAWYVLPERTAAPVSLVGGLALGYTAPQYVAVGDEAGVDVSVLNTSAAPVSVTVSLVFADAALPIASSPGESTSAMIEDLPSGAVATRTLRFVLKDRPRAASLRFTLRATLPDGSSQDTAPDSLGVTPLVSRLKSALIWLLGGSGLLALALNFMWDRLSKWLFPEH